MYDYTGREFTPGVTPEMGHGRREPARTCVEVHGQRRSREPLPVVRHQPADRVLPRPRPDLRHGVHRRERHRLAGRAERPRRRDGDPRRQHDQLPDDGHDGERRDVLLQPARRRLVHRVLRIARSGYQQSAPASGAACTTGAADRLPPPGPFDRLDHQQLRVPAARLGLRHGLQRREPEPRPTTTARRSRAGRSRSTAERSRCRRRPNATARTRSRWPSRRPTNYTLCETPPSGTWAQDVPLPSTTTVCGPNKNGNGASGVPNELLKGLQFTASRSATRSPARTSATSPRSRAIPTEPFHTQPGLRRQPSARTCSTGGRRRTPGSSSTRAGRTARRSSASGAATPTGSPVPAARAHHLAGCAEPGRDAQVHAPRLHGHVPVRRAHPQTMPCLQRRPAGSVRSHAALGERLHEPGQRGCGASGHGATSCVISLTPSGTVGLRRRVARRRRLLGRRRPPSSQADRAQASPRSCARRSISRSSSLGLGARLAETAPRTPDEQLLVEQALCLRPPRVHGRAARGPPAGGRAQRGRRPGPARPQRHRAPRPHRRRRPPRRAPRARPPARPPVRARARGRCPLRARVRRSPTPAASAPMRVERLERAMRVAAVERTAGELRSRRRARTV